MQSHVVSGSIEPDAREGVKPSRVSGLDVYHLLAGCDGLYRQNTVEWRATRLVCPALPIGSFGGDGRGDDGIG